MRRLLLTLSLIGLMALPTAAWAQIVYTDNTVEIPINYVEWISVGGSYKTVGYSTHPDYDNHYDLHMAWKAGKLDKHISKYWEIDRVVDGGRVSLTLLGDNIGGADFTAFVQKIISNNRGNAGDNFVAEYFPDSIVLNEKYIAFAGASSDDKVKFRSEVRDGFVGDLWGDFFTYHGPCFSLIREYSNGTKLYRNVCN